MLTSRQLGKLSKSPRKDTQVLCTGHSWKNTVIGVSFLEVTLLFDLCRLVSLRLHTALRFGYATKQVARGAKSSKSLSRYVELGARGIGLIRPGKTLYETLKYL